MLLIVGTFRLPPDNLKRALPVMAVMVNTSRAEHGCHEYCYSEDVLQPGLIHVKELWSDQSSLDQHLTSKHITEWRSSWPGLGIGERDLRVYEVGQARET